MLVEGWFCGEGKLTALTGITAVIGALERQAGRQAGRARVQQQVLLHISQVTHRAEVWCVCTFCCILDCSVKVREEGNLLILMLMLMIHGNSDNYYGHVSVYPSTTNPLCAFDNN